MAWILLIIKSMKTKLLFTIALFLIFTVNLFAGESVSDSDNDMIYDIFDAFPADPYEWVDTDGDGIGNIEDVDSDNDNINDIKDPYPLNTYKKSYKTEDLTSYKIVDVHQNVKEIDCELVEALYIPLTEIGAVDLKIDIVPIISIEKGILETYIQNEDIAIRYIKELIVVLENNNIKNAAFCVHSLNEYKARKLLCNLAAALRNRGISVGVFVEFDNDIDLYIDELKDYLDDFIINKPEMYTVEEIIEELSIMIPIKRIVIQM